MIDLMKPHELHSPMKMGNAKTPTPIKGAPNNKGAPASNRNVTSKFVEEPNAREKRDPVFPKPRTQAEAQPVHPKPRVQAEAQPPVFPKSRAQAEAQSPVFPKPRAQAEAQSPVFPKPRAQAEAQPPVFPKPRSQAEAQPPVFPKPRAQAEAQPAHPKPRAQAEAQPQYHAKPRAQAEAQPQYHAKPRAQAEAQPQYHAKPRAQAEAHPQYHAKTRAQSQSQSKTASLSHLDPQQLNKKVPTKQTSSKFLEVPNKKAAAANAAAWENKRNEELNKKPHPLHHKLNTLKQVEFNLPDGKYAIKLTPPDEPNGSVNPSSKGQKAVAQNQTLEIAQKRKANAPNLSQNMRTTTRMHLRGKAV